MKTEKDWKIFNDDKKIINEEFNLLFYRNAQRLEKIS